MPPIGWICPVERGEHPWDHFETCKVRHKHMKGGGVAPFPPWLARFAQHKILSDLRHAGSGLTVSRCLGCPRANMIAMTQPFYLDPTKVSARDRGSALHVMAGEYCDPDLWYTETNDPIRMTMGGRLFQSMVPSLGVDGTHVTEAGVLVTTAVDALNRDMTEHINWKFGKDWSVAYRPKNGKCKDDHRVQLNLESLIIAQQPWAVEAGYSHEHTKHIIWDHALGRNEGPAPLIGDPMDEAEILRHVPGSTDKARALYSVSDIVEMYVMMLREKDECAGDATKLEELCAKVPCTGETQFNGRGCEDFCDVTTCSARLIRKYGRPEEIVAADNEGDE